MYSNEFEEAFPSFCPDMSTTRRKIICFLWCGCPLLRAGRQRGALPSRRSAYSSSWIFQSRRNCEGSSCISWDGRGIRYPTNNPAGDIMFSPPPCCQGEKMQPQLLTKIRHISQEKPSSGEPSLRRMVLLSK